MVQMRWLRLAVVVLSFWPLASDGAEPSREAPVPIGVRWAPGQRLTYRLTREVKVLHPPVPGFPADAPKPHETETWTFDLVPREVTAARTTADLVLRSLRFQDEWPGRAPSLFDSTDPAAARPDDPLHPFAVRSVLLSVPLTAVFGPDGRLSELSGAERIGEHITTALGVSALVDPDLRQSLREEFADGGDVKLTLQRAFALSSGAPAGVGGEWTAVAEETHLASGRAKVGHRFRLEAVDATGQARVSSRIEAARDAAGQIPWDRTDEEDDAYERALDSYAGTAEAVFDLDLGHVRRYASTVRVAWTNRPDKDVPYERVEEESELRHTLELLESSGPSAPRPVLAAAPAGPALPPFAAFQKGLAERCWVSTRDDSTPQVKGAAAATAECLRRVLLAELDRVLVPMKSKEPGRFIALMREQAAWNRVVALSCPFFDEIQFAALDEGIWGFGTIYGLQQMACEQGTAIERAYYAAALRAEEAGLLAAHVSESAGPAAKTREELRETRAGLEPWLKDESAERLAGHRPVTAEDARRLLGAVTSFEKQARELAGASCANWPALAQAHGGAGPCKDAMESYYLRHR
jgi:hypothetical protein